MREHLRAGIAVYNEGSYRAAHDAWEERWLGLTRGSDDERLLHGLIQFTVGIHHASTGNWAGAEKLGGRALGYLDGLGETYRGVDLDPVRPFLRVLDADPESFPEREPPMLTHEGTAVVFTDLDLEALAIAAAAIADDQGYEDDPIEAIRNPMRNRPPDATDRPAEQTNSRSLLLAFLQGEPDRDAAYEHLEERVREQ